MIETEPHVVRGDPSAEGLSARAAAAAARAAQAGQVLDCLRALALLDARDALDWLAENAAASALVDSGQVSAAVRTVLDNLGARAADAGEPLTRVLQRFSSQLEPGTLAAVAQAMPPGMRGGLMEAALHQALEREPGHAGLLRLVADMAVRRGHITAHDYLTRLGRADPTLATVSWVHRLRPKIPPSPDPSVRATLLGSFTVDPIVPYLDLECRALGLRPEIYQAPFNTWNQEILDPKSGLRRFAPQIVFLAISIDDLVPELSGWLPAAALKEAGQQALRRVGAVCKALSQWSDAVLVVHGFWSAHRDPAGPVAGRSPDARATWLASLNLRLADMLRALPRAYLLDLAEVLLWRPGGTADDPKWRHYASMRVSESAVPELARAYARYIAPLMGLTRKCVVLDLDNTLWGGLVGEDGIDGIRLGSTAPGSEFVEFQRYLLTLTERGILLAVNSKNNLEDALAVLQRHEAMVLREEAFSALRINWLPKPENMASLAEELNVGLDSMVFLDDNPHERELMRRALPQVLTPELPADPARYRAVVEALPQLSSLVVTDTDRKRSEQYRAKRRREQELARATTLEDYLASLQMEVTISAASDRDLPRLHQLIQRTNQFNLTSRRYDFGQLASLARDGAWRCYVLRARDRFGDHGLVAAALARAGGSTWTVDTLLMSCRVIGYGVETALIAFLSRQAATAGATRLAGEYVPTAKNAPAREFYDRHGFIRQGRADGAEFWTRDLGDGGVAFPSWIALGGLP